MWLLVELHTGTFFGSESDETEKKRVILQDLIISSRLIIQTPPSSYMGPILAGGELASPPLTLCDASLWPEYW
jgi:hypothetical protein